jgi:hypothetical protein
MKIPMFVLLSFNLPQLVSSHVPPLHSLTCSNTAVVMSFHESFDMEFHNQAVMRTSHFILFVFNSESVWEHDAEENILT